MDTIAVWWNGECSETKPKLEIHLNHWRLDRTFIGLCTFESKCFLDIGLKITDMGNKITNINIFFPYEIKEDEISDIGKLIYKDIKLIPLIFNENYSIENESIPKTIIINQNKKIKFYFYCIDTKNDITSESKYNGKIISIRYPEIKGKEENVPIYFRIRISSGFAEKLCYIYQPKNSFLESAFSNVEIFELRINGTRNLEPSMIEELSKREQKQFNIHKVHVFILRKANQEYILSNNDLNSIRELEENNWNKYINDKIYKHKKTLAYHLKEQDEENNIPEINILFKFKLESNNWVTIIKYIIVFFLLSLAANWLSKLLFK